MAKIIVLEGPDGVGKSTQCNVLKEELESRGKRVFLKSFPSRESIIGVTIRNMMSKEDFNVEEVQCLCLREQIEFFKSMKVVEEFYDYIICDRSFLSTYIYSKAFSLGEHFLQGIVDSYKASGIEYDFMFVLGKNYAKTIDKDATDSIEANTSVMDSVKSLYFDKSLIDISTSSKTTTILTGIKKDKNTNDMLKVILGK